MAEYTPNYNLEKPAGAEKYYISKFNANADRIDTALKGHDDTIAANKTQEQQDIADTKEYADNAVSAHNMSEGENVHPYLQRKITEAANKALADAKDYAYSKVETDERISVHNSDESAHQDIRNLINSMGTNVQTGIENAIAVHNASPESHPDIRTDYVSYTDNAVSTHNNDPEAHGGKDVVYTKLATLGNGFTSSMTYADILTAFQDGKNVVALLNSGGEVQLETDGTNITGKRTVIEGDKMVLETYVLDPETNMFTKTSTKYLLDYAPAIAGEAIADVSIIVDPESDDEAAKIGGADWNAKEGEDGYIANKPFGEIESSGTTITNKIDPKFTENSFVIDVDLATDDENPTISTNAKDILNAINSNLPIYIHNQNDSEKYIYPIDYCYYMLWSNSVSIYFTDGDTIYYRIDASVGDEEASTAIYNLAMNNKMVYWCQKGNNKFTFWQSNDYGKFTGKKVSNLYWIGSNTTLVYENEIYTLVSANYYKDSSKKQKVYTYRHESYSSKVNNVLPLTIKELTVTVMGDGSTAVEGTDYTVEYTSTINGIQTVPMVTFMTYDGSSVLGTSTVTNGVPDSIPTAPERTGGTDYTYVHVGWSTEANATNTVPLENITDSMTVYAVYRQKFNDETIVDTWDEIINSTTDGSYKTKYKLGDTKSVNLGSEGTHLMQLVAFDADDKADGSGKAPMTWVMKDLLPTTHRMNPAKVDGTEGTGTLGGYDKTEMKSYLTETILPLFPADVRNNIVPVTKHQKAFDASGTTFQESTTETLWIPGHKEIFNSTSYDTDGPAYSDVFKDATSRIKKRNGSAYNWWLRSAYITSYFRYVSNSGNDNYYIAINAYGVCPGFCF